MPTCSQGHDSADEDFCDVCGLSLDAPAPVAEPVADEATAPCPSCGAPLDGRFCEGCGADSLAAPRPAPVSAPLPSSAPSSPVSSPVVRSWSVTVSADRRYYAAVVAEGGPDASSLAFPPFCPERYFPLRGQQVSVGRRSASRGILPDIDLTGPPEDPGVSRLHALFVCTPDGAWSIVDLDSANGTKVNYSSAELRPNEPRDLRDGDKVHVGAWTTLTLTAD